LLNNLKESFIVKIDELKVVHFDLRSTKTKKTYIEVFDKKARSTKRAMRQQTDQLGIINNHM